MNASNFVYHSFRAGMATPGSAEWIVRTRDRENHSPPYASRFAALHPAGRDVPRERVGESGPLIRLVMRASTLSPPQSQQESRDHF